MALLCTLLATPGIAQEPSGQSAELLSLEVRRGPAGATATLRFPGSAAPPGARHFSLRSPARYVLDLSATRAADGLQPTFPADDPLITGIRFGQHPSTLRIVFDLRAVPATDEVALQRQGGALVLVFAARAPVTGAAVAAPPDPAPGSESPAAPPAATASNAVQAGVAAPTPAPESPAPAAKPRSLVFGAPAAPAANTGAPLAVEGTGSASSDGWKLSLDRGLLEAGHIDGDGGNLHLQTIPALEGPLSDRLQLRLSARVDGQYQTGDLPSLRRTRADYDASWLRFDDGTWRVTAGAQRIIWGRTDEFSPTDRLSTRDYTRLMMDDLADRRRANPALRIEWRRASQRLDFVYLPTFREAELSGRESIWYPLDAATGAIAGLPLPDAARNLLAGARVDNDIDGDEGFGLRYTRTGSRWDLALTAQRVHNPEPYFTLGRMPTATAPATLRAVYPRTTVLGGDIATALGAWTLRAEAAWLSDSAYTRRSDFQLQTAEEVNWVLGAEVFPGDGDTRLTTQLSGRHLRDSDDAIDFTDVVTVFGELETPFNAAGLPWRAQLRYSVRLDEDGTYLNPEVTFTGWEPSELYFGIHLYDGDYGTAEGFYADRDSAVIGWRAKF